MMSSDNKIFLKLLLAFVLIASLSLCASAATFNVGPNQGAYATDGAADEAQINAAITAASTGDTVYLHDGSYNIAGHIYMKSGIKLQGSGYESCILTAGPNAGGASGVKGIFDGVINCGSGSNIEISGFTATSTSNSHDDGGHGDQRHFIYFASGGSSGQGVKIHDIYFKRFLYNDAINLHGVDGTQIYNCVINTAGHDSVQLLSNSQNVLIYNCWSRIEINTGIRFDGAHNCRLAYCTFDGNYGGWNVWELQGDQSGNSADHCVVKNMGFPIFGYAGAFTVTNSIFANTGSTSPITNTNGNQVGANPNTDWTAQGYGYGTSTYGSIGGGTGSAPPADSTLPGDSYLPTTPYDGSTLPRISSPLNGETLSTRNGFVDFQWKSVNSSQYKIQVASDSTFTTTLFDVTYPASTRRPTYQLSEPMSDGVYYWRVAAYNDVTKAWTAYSDFSSFVISGNVEIASAGIWGIVRDSTSKQPIEGAVVTVVNPEVPPWSQTYVTNEDGSYTIPVENGTFYVYAAATDYQSTIVGSGLPVVITTDEKRQDIDLVKSASFFKPSYCEFTLSDWTSLTRYSGVAVRAYEYTSNGVPTDISLEDKDFFTDDDGKVTLAFSETKMYYVTFKDSSQNIDQNLSITGSSTSKWVIIHKTDAVDIPETVAGDVVKYYEWQSTANLSSALINQTIMSTTNDTISWNIEITRIFDNGTVYLRDDGTPYFQYITSGTGNTNLSTAVHNNMTYVVKANVRHPLADDIAHYTDQEVIRGSPILRGFDFGFDQQWKYTVIGIILVLFVFGIFGSRSAGIAAMMSVFVTAFNLHTGWFVFDPIQMAMYCLAILLAVGYNLKRGN